MYRDDNSTRAAEVTKARRRVQSRTIASQYVMQLLTQHSGIRRSDIPDDLVAAKRAELRLKRLIAVKS